MLVLLKQTFDTDTKIVLKDGKVSEDGVTMVINPYDEYALEQAIRIKEAGGGTVNVICVGPARSEEALRKALAMGADEAVLIDPPADGDEYTLARILAAACKARPFDLVLGGNLSVDNGAGQVAIRVAHGLGIPYVGAATKVEVSGNNVRVERDAEGDVEVITASAPLLITAQQGLAEPRLPSLPGIMKAKKKPITRQTPADLGVDAPARTEIIDLKAADSSRQTKMLAGTAAEQATQLVHLLREEAKVV